MISCDYEPHHHLPLYLESNQVKNPMGVFKEFFKRYDLPYARLYLWQLLKWYCREEDTDILLDHSECFSFYEEIVCVIEAANLILLKEQESAETRNDISTTKYADEKIITEFNEPECPLDSVINIIKNSMDVEKIYLLGSFPLQPAGLGDEYDLLILVKDTRNRPIEEFESLIQNRSTDTVPVFNSVFKLSKVNALMLNGNYFFSTFCIPDRLIYDAGRVEIETPPASHNLPGWKELDQTHKAILEKANGFLIGAIHYFEQHEYSLCGFMLHQAAEHGLNSLLQPLMQFRVQTHNLHKLMRMARRFSIEVFNLFPRDTDSEIRLFQTLQKAYIHARYKDSFEVCAEDAELLLERIKFLLEKIGEEFERIVCEFDWACEEGGI
ncbi:MAG: HEPN domain-containing protein [Ginsengibacter sp.]